MKTKRISIPKPCSQSWEEMQPQGEGRFCNSCQKTVIDFTSYDDKAFLAYFQKNNTTPCGRFTKRQLELDIPIQQTFLLRPANLYKYAAAGLLSITGITVQAQTRQPRLQEQSPPIPNNPAQSTVIEQRSIIFEGKVIDENDQPLPGAGIHIENSKENTVTTDMGGRFSLPVNERERALGVLQISALGYKTKTVELSTFNNSKTIKLDISLDYVSDIMVVGGVHSKTTFWKRITRIFRNKH